MKRGIVNYLSVAVCLFALIITSSVYSASAVEKNVETKSVKSNNLIELRTDAIKESKKLVKLLASNESNVCTFDASSNSIRAFDSFKFTKDSNKDYQSIANKIYDSLFDAYDVSGMSDIGYFISSTEGGDSYGIEKKGSNKFTINGNVGNGKTLDGGDLREIFDIVYQCYQIDSMLSGSSMAVKVGTSGVDRSFKMYDGKWEIIIRESIGSELYDINNYSNSYIDKKLGSAQSPLDMYYNGGSGDYYTSLDAAINKYIDKAYRYQKKLKEFLNDVPRTSRYEAVRYIHDYIVLNSSYFDFASTAELSNYTTGFPEYSARAEAGVMGYAGRRGMICHSFSETFKVLCQKVGIPVIQVSGKAKESAAAAPGGHAWNYVKMDDNKWYAVDCTWDDPGKSSKGISGSENYDFFLVGSNTEWRDMPFSTSHQEIGINSPNMLYLKLCGVELETKQDGSYKLSSNETISETAYKFTGHTQHDLVKVSEKDASCQNTGIKEHYQCTKCPGLFSDAEGKHPVKYDSLIIPKKEHDPVKVEAKNEACNNPSFNNSTVEYWECKDCGSYFHEEECINQYVLAEDTEYIPQHRWIEVRVSKPTCMSDGYTQTTFSELEDGVYTTHKLYRCLDCGEIGFLQEAGEIAAARHTDAGISTQNVALDDIVIPATGHKFNDEGICTVCHESDPCKGKEHDFEIIEAHYPESGCVSASDEAVYYNKHKRCKNCGRLFTAPLMATTPSVETTMDELRVYHKCANGLLEQMQTGTGFISPEDCLTYYQQGILWYRAGGCDIRLKKPYWYCDKCNRCYSDQKGTHETIEKYVDLGNGLEGYVGHDLDASGNCKHANPNGVSELCCHYKHTQTNGVCDGLTAIGEERFGKGSSATVIKEHYICLGCGNKYIKNGDEFVKVTDESQLISKGENIHTHTIVASWAVEKDVSRSFSGSCLEKCDNGYSYCKQCGKIWSKDLCTDNNKYYNDEPIRLSDNQIDSKYNLTEAQLNEVAGLKPHDFTEITTKEPTCTDIGYKSHCYKCEKCGCYFETNESVQDASKALPVDQVEIEPKEHSFNNGKCIYCHKDERYAACVLKHYEKIEPSCEYHGIKEHWACEKCGKVFDANIASEEHETNVKDLDIPTKQHDLQKQEKAATCTTPGISESWKCKECGALFADSQAKESVRFKEIYIAPLKHSFVGDSCTRCGETLSGHTHSLVVNEIGDNTYYICSTCDKAFTDKNAANETTVPVINKASIKAQVHHLSRAIFVEPTCYAEGSKPYYYCTDPGCDKLFMDPDGTIEIDKRNIAIPAVGHMVYSGFCEKCFRYNTEYNWLPEEQPTCEMDGHPMCYQFMAKSATLFSDRHGKTALAVANQYKATGHSLKKVAETAEYKEYWACEDCDKCYENNEASGVAHLKSYFKKEITPIEEPEETNPTDPSGPTGPTDPTGPSGDPSGTSGGIGEVVQDLVDDFLGINTVESNITDNKETKSFTNAEIKDIIKNPKGDDIVIKLSSAKLDNVNESKINLPKDLVKQVANKDMNLVIETGAAKVAFDTKALDKIGTKNVTLSLNKNIGGNKVNLDITLKSSNKQITQFGNGSVQISLPLPKGMDKDAKVLYNKDKKYVEDMKATVSGGNIEFKTNHFSTYSLVNKDEANKMLLNSIKASTLGAIKATSTKKAVNLSWKKAKGTTPTEITIYRSLKAKKEFSRIKTLKGGAKSYTDKAKLKKGKKYYYKVVGGVSVDGETHYLKESKVVSVKHK